MVEATIYKNRIGWRLAIAALTTCLAAAVALVVAVEPAQAFCEDGDRAVFSIGSPHQGELRPASGECNGNDTYNGRLYDTEADGRGVFLYLCDTRSTGCTEFYVGGNGNSVPVSKRDTDGQILARLRWGAVSVEAYMSGY